LGSSDNPKDSWYREQISGDVVGTVNHSSCPSVNKFGALGHREDEGMNWEASITEKDTPAKGVQVPG